MTKVADIIANWREKQASLTCAEVVATLESLSYVVKRRSSGNHRTVSHPRIAGWFGTNFDCGHGKNPQVKANYVRSLIRILESHSEFL